MIKLISMMALTTIAYGVYLETGMFTAGSIYIISVVLWNWIPVVENRDDFRHKIFIKTVDELIAIQKAINRKMSSLSPEQHDEAYEKMRSDLLEQSHQQK